MIDLTAPDHDVLSIPLTTFGPLPAHCRLALALVLSGVPPAQIADLRFEDIALGDDGVFRPVSDTSDTDAGGSL